MSNGELLLNMCAEHGLIVANSFFQHRRSHIKTWYKWNNTDQTSQIDFILIKKTKRSNLIGSRALPNINIDTDHRPVIIKQKTIHSEIRNKKVAKVVINFRKLQDSTVRDDFQDEIKKLYKNLPDKYSSVNIEWLNFKSAMLDTLRNKCGTRKVGQGKRLRTAWWNNKVKESISKKKKAYKIWITSKSEQDYV